MYVKLPDCYYYEDQKKAEAIAYCENPDNWLKEQDETNFYAIKKRNDLHQEIDWKQFLPTIMNLITECTNKSRSYKIKFVLEN
jgi:hypothetical protein